MHPHQPAAKSRRKGNPLLGAIGLAIIVVLCGVGIIMVNLDGPDDEPAGAADATAAAQAGIPPTPGAQAWAAYIAALNAIDRDIVHGKEEKAVDRGRNQCSSVKEWPNDQPRLVDLTNQRFTSPGHPNGFGASKAARILAAVRKHICPTY